MSLKIVESFSRVWPQWAASMTVNLLSVSFGLVTGWTSPYLAQLTHKESWLTVTDTEAAWIASLMPLGRIFGAIIGFYTLQYFGSKTSVMASTVPITIGWLCAIFANSTFWLYVFRILSGIALGMYFSCFAFYIGEIATTNIRGALVSVITNGIPIGMLIGTIMGSLVSMMWFGIISLILNIFYIVIFPFMPQTPHYYVRKNKMDEAKNALQWYDRKANVDMELEVIKYFVRSSQTTSFRERLQQMTEKKNKRAFYIVILLFIFMHFSGINTVTFYMEIIMRKAQVTIVEPATVVNLTNAVNIVYGWIGVYLIDRCGRRILVAISCCFVIIAMTLLALHFMLLDQNFDPKSLEWLPILSMMLFAMMYIGLIPVPSTMLSEVFPDDLKSIAGFATSTTSALSAFICSRTYQPLIDLISEKYVFLSYVLPMIACLVFLVYCVPETKGKSLQEIQDMFIRQSMQAEAIQRARRIKNNENHSQENL